MVGVEDQRLARKPEVVVPEVEPRDDIPADPRQETTRRETLDQAVAGGRQLEPAAVAPGEEDVVVLVAQDGPRPAGDLVLDLDRVEVVRGRVDVGEDRPGPRPADGPGGGENDGAKIAPTADVKILDQTKLGVAVEVSAEVNPTKNAFITAESNTLSNPLSKKVKKK